MLILILKIVLIGLNKSKMNRKIENKRYNRGFLVLLLLFLITIFASFNSFTVLAESCQCDGFPSLAKIVEKAIPAVVNISTEFKVKINNNISNSPGNSNTPNYRGIFPGLPYEEFREFFERLEPFFDHIPQGEREGASLGSGFIIDPEGTIVTNNHLIANADEIKITLSNGQQYIAKILGSDIKTDLAVLKIEAKEKLPYVEFGSSENAKAGDWVIAIGNPFGLGGSVTAGIISARGRDINISNSSDFIQTDAAINAGNSGGPLFNTEGKVIGINTAIYSASGGNIGIGFAVPADAVKDSIKTLSHGEVIKRGWIGVQIQEITKDIKDSIGSIGDGNIKGVLISNVEKNSPANKAGLQLGDVIIKINDINIDSTKKLVRIISNTKIGNEINLNIIRKSFKGKQEKQDIILIKIKVAELKENVLTATQNSKNNAFLEILGLTVANSTSLLKQQYNIKDDLEGVIVTEVKRLQSTLIRKGDLIVGVENSYKIKNIEDLKAAIAALKENNKTSMLLLINRRGQTIFTGVKIE